MVKYGNIPILHYSSLTHSCLRFGRDNFQEASKVAHRAGDVNWDRFKFVVFDVPNHAGRYRERYEQLGKEPTLSLSLFSSLLSLSLPPPK